MAGGLPSAILCYQKQYKKQIGIFRLMVSVSLKLIRRFNLNSPLQVRFRVRYPKRRQSPI